MYLTIGVDFFLLQSGKEYLIRHTTCIIITSSVFFTFFTREWLNISQPVFVLFSFYNAEIFLHKPRRTIFFQFEIIIHILKDLFVQSHLSPRSLILPPRRGRLSQNDTFNNFNNFPEGGPTPDDSVPVVMTMAGQVYMHATRLAARETLLSDMTGIVRSLRDREVACSASDRHTTRHPPNHNIV